MALTETTIPMIAMPPVLPAPLPEGETPNPSVYGVTPADVPPPSNSGPSLQAQPSPMQVKPAYKTAGELGDCTRRLCAPNLLGLPGVIPQCWCWSDIIFYTAASLMVLIGAWSMYLSRR